MDRLDRFSHYALIFLGVFAMFAALRITQTFMVPLVLALVAGVILSPLTERVSRWGMPPVIGALLSLVLTLGVIGGIIAALQPLVMRLMDAAPRIWADMQNALEAVHRTFRGVTQISDGMREALETGPTAAAAAADPASENALEDAIPTMADALMFAPSFAGQLLVFIGVLFFFLLTRKDIYDWAARMSPPDERGDLPRRLLHAEKLVARYFLTITMINVAEGALVALALYVIGMPAAPLWGLVVFLLNYLLYIGPAIVTVALLVAGMTEFTGTYVLAPVAAYVLINGAEGQFITPTLIGRHTEVNPLLVFLSLIFGMWLWGPVGGIVAIPLLLWVLQLNNTSRKAQLASAEI
ncbi:AI-2E family transporter [Falsirhodobacter halotolerans]|uniref:AI-2E family transporter n=1 Tax=Falsirhodobacter halotolerans TaxID=1146892 RepID=UPI001FD349F7|nr:AI-2E family transporter [Falsirhodobacter halotolerans]MCJ8140745.1 AI-2E family transporter [Falsirhodobacter halotolerans]